MRRKVKAVLVILILMATALCVLFVLSPKKAADNKTADKGSYEHYIESENTDSEDNDLYFYGK